MTTTALAPTHDLGSIETVLIQGDLGKLTEVQRVNYYNALCKSLGLNPLTQPFAYITLQGKLVLYAKRDATEQLRKIHGVSVEKLEKEHVGELYIVTAYAKDATGRTDASTGVVPVGALKGEALANALMKAETKAKRRVTLSICGLGLLDESEVESVRSLPTVDVQTGEESTKPTPPEKFAAWWATLPGVAEDGHDALQKAWNTAPAGCKAYVAKYEREAWAELKRKAYEADGIEIAQVPE